MTTVPYTFGNESSPIPLSQLDANFAVTPSYANTAGNVVNAVQANITSVGTLTSVSVSGNVNSGNLRTAGSISATGNITVGNIATGGAVSAFGTVTGGALSTTGNVTGANILTSGLISSTGNVIGGNIRTTGQMSAQGNITAQSQIVATGNISTSAYFIGNFLGNISGNIVGAPGSNTQILFNTAGNVDAVGGLTYNKDSNVLTVLGTISSQGNVNVGGVLAVTGIATVPTAATGTANNQVASTAFVNNQINQYANSVAITGGNVTVTGIIANTITANTSVTITNWTIREVSNTLYFQFSGSNVAKLDSFGNFTTIGNVTGFGIV
jgi:hypothetical protein